MLKKIFIGIILILLVGFLAIKFGTTLGRNKSLTDNAHKYAVSKSEREFLEEVDLFNNTIPQNFPDYLIYYNSTKHAVFPDSTSDDSVSVVFITKDGANQVVDYYKKTLERLGYESRFGWDFSTDPQGLPTANSTYSMNKQRALLTITEWESFNSIGITYYVND